MPTGDRPRLLALDSASMYFRAFHGVPDTVRAPDGTPVNAVRGFLDAVARLMGDVSPGAVAAAWDVDWRPQWRVDLLPSYKAHRVEQEVAGGTDVEEAPDALATQVPVIVEALGLLGIAIVGADEHEADDVLGTLATTWQGPVDVVTGDRDLIQLVDDEARVRVIYTGRGMSRLEVLDEAFVREKYAVEARAYADFAVLRGDPSDGLPGVRGIGEKTAASLLDRYTDLDGIIAAVDDPDAAMPPRARSNLRDAVDYLAAAPDVVRVVRDLDVGSPDLTVGPLDDAARAAFARFADRWGLGGSADRIVEALDTVGA